MPRLPRTQRRWLEVVNTTSQENVTPSFGNNANVMCYLDDIYVTKAIDAAESNCMGMK